MQYSFRQQHDCKYIYKVRQLYHLFSCVRARATEVIIMEKETKITHILCKFSCNETEQSVFRK